MASVLSRQLLVFIIGLLLFHISSKPLFGSDSVVCRIALQAIEQLRPLHDWLGRNPEVSRVFLIFEGLESGWLGATNPTAGWANASETIDPKPFTNNVVLWKQNASNYLDRAINAVTDRTRFSIAVKSGRLVAPDTEAGRASARLLLENALRDNTTLGFLSPEERLSKLQRLNSAIRAEDISSDSRVPLPNSDPFQGKPFSFETAKPMLEEYLGQGKALLVNNGPARLRVRFDLSLMKALLGIDVDKRYVVAVLEALRKGRAETGSNATGIKPMLFEDKKKNKWEIKASVHGQFGNWRIIGRLDKDTNTLLFDEFDKNAH